MEVKFYKSCSETPLSVFIECLVEGNLKALIISGEPTSEQLAMAWAELFSEFTDLNADNEQMYVLTLQGEITLIHEEIAEVEGVLYFLSPEMLPFSITMKDELLNVLHKYDYPHEIDVSEPGYVEQLEIIANRLCPIKLKLQMKMRELSEYNQEKKNDSIDKQYFSRMLVRLSKFQGFNIRAKDITVEEFVMICKEYNSYYKKQEEPED